VFAIVEASLNSAVQHLAWTPSPAPSCAFQFFARRNTLLGHPLSRTELCFSIFLETFVALFKNDSKI
jgi:hypothetical protein